MYESAEHMARLRSRIAGIERRRPDAAAALFASGDARLDAVLGGGLARGKLHEIFAQADDDASSGTGFAAMLALRAQRPGTAILWLRTDQAQRRSGCFYAPGFADLGGDPAAVMLALAPDEKALLRCAGDAVRAPGLGAVVIECWGKAPMLDLTASRRLTLAAEQSAVAVLLLRIDAVPTTSAAETRWGVSAAPSQPLAANAPGQIMLDIELLRRRAGSSGMRWRVEWNRDERAFREAALSGAVLPLPLGGSADDLPAEPVRRIA